VQWKREWIIVQCARAAFASQEPLCDFSLHHRPPFASQLLSQPSSSRETDSLTFSLSHTAAKKWRPLHVQSAWIYKGMDRVLRDFAPEALPRDTSDLRADVFFSGSLKKFSSSYWVELGWLLLLMQSKSSPSQGQVQRQLKPSQDRVQSKDDNL